MHIPRGNCVSCGAPKYTNADDHRVVVRTCDCAGPRWVRLQVDEHGNQRPDWPPTSPFMELQR